MAGAISGTAITNSPKLGQTLDTITLTINCLCNYKCPHCYLDYSSVEKYIRNEVIDRIFQLDFRHLAIVGKEPFADQHSVEISKLLVELCHKNNKTISFVTNGSNLDLLNDFDLSKIKFIDVSFDGGIQTYEQYRGGDIKKIIQNINLLHENGLKEINALHVLSERTMHCLSDMIGLNSYSRFNKIMFSPYLNTNSINSRSEQIISLKQMLQALKNSKDFMNASNAFLLLDKYNFVSESELTIENIDSFIEELSLTNKIFLVKKDPIEYGFVRIAYNGYVLTPTDSLNTAEYDVKKISIYDFSDDVFCDMILSEKQVEIIE